MRQQLVSDRPCRPVRNVRDWRHRIVIETLTVLSIQRTFILASEASVCVSSSVRD